jgi:hypothetical protein
MLRPLVFRANRCKLLPENAVAAFGDFELRATRFFDTKFDYFGTLATPLALQYAVILETRRSNIRVLL